MTTAKLLVVDAGLPSARLWCGGRNLAAAYFEGSPGQAPWRDLSFDLGGPLVHQASALFEQDWAFAKGARMGGHESTPTASQAAPFPVDGAHLAASGPDQADDTLLALLVTAAYRARQRIALATPYFVPDPALLMALCLAARRGVAIDLLLPARSNHRLSDPVGERRQPSYRLATGERLNPTDDPAVFETLDRSRRFTLRQPP